MVLIFERETFTYPTLTFTTSVRLILALRVALISAVDWGAGTRYKITGATVSATVKFEKFKVAVLNTLPEVSFTKKVRYTCPRYVVLNNLYSYYDDLL